MLETTGEQPSSTIEPELTRKEELKKFLGEVVNSFHTPMYALLFAVILMASAGVNCQP